MSDLFSFAPIFITIANQIQCPNQAAEHKCKTHVRACGHVWLLACSFRRRVQERESVADEQHKLFSIDNYTRPNTSKHVQTSVCDEIVLQ